MTALKESSQKHILNTLHHDGSPFSSTRQSTAGAQP
jgi:hypothetical protein